MASETSVPAAGISSVFKKKKGKKTRGSNLNNDSTSVIQKTEEKPKLAKVQDILGGLDKAEDDGWAEVVDKKSVVATGGKQVSDLIDMTALMTEDESTAAKLEKQDIKQAFHEARTMKDTKKEEASDPDKEDSKEGDSTKSKGFLFANGAGRSGDPSVAGGSAGALAGGWRKRMEERELRQRQEELSVDNVSAFPSLKDAMSAPAKPKQSAPEPETHRWGRRAGGGSAAVAAIKAALGRSEEEKAAPASEADAPPPAAPVASGPAATSVEEAKTKPKAAAPVWVAPVQTDAGADAGSGSAGGEGETKVVAEAVAAMAAIDVEEKDKDKDKEKEPAAAVETDKDALVQQFGKKKKKKKKPTAEEQAGSEP